MFYTIMMMNGALLRAGAPCWRHRLLETTEEHEHYDYPSKKHLF